MLDAKHPLCRETAVQSNFRILQCIREIQYGNCVHIYLETPNATLMFMEGLWVLDTTPHIDVLNICAILG